MKIFSNDNLKYGGLSIKNNYKFIKKFRVCLIIVFKTIFYFKKNGFDNKKIKNYFMFLKIKNKVFSSYIFLLF